jgi:hypothetical protein
MMNNKGSDGRCFMRMDTRKERERDKIVAYIPKCWWSNVGPDASGR